jgi:hypothetical protein
MWQPINPNGNSGILDPNDANLAVGRIYTYSYTVPGGSNLLLRIMAEEDVNAEAGTTGPLKSLWMAPATASGDLHTGRFKVLEAWKGLTVSIGLVSEDLAQGYGGESYLVV